MPYTRRGECSKGKLRRWWRIMQVGNAQRAWRFVFVHRGLYEEKQSTQVLHELSCPWRLVILEMGENLW